MKAIIVAAGRGRRLGSETDEIPKCMVTLGGRPILSWQLEALRAAGVDDVVVVRGYLGDRIKADGARFVDNPQWETNNILASLFFAEAEMAGGFLFSYSDIVFGKSVAATLLKTQANIGLVVDRTWRETYRGRTKHPVSEAELARVVDSADGPRIARVGKGVVSADDAAGEFIGLAWFSAAGAEALRRAWTDALGAGMEAPYGRAPHLRVAYLTDALNAVAERGVRIEPLFIDGSWREIDTDQDLARAEQVLAALRA